MIEKTLLLIKPNAIAQRHAGEIISIVETRGFVLRDIKILQFDRALAETFYQEHKGKDFYERLVGFMCSGPTIALVLEKQDAVAVLREMVGDAEPHKREPGTIRYLYADGVTENAVHASDSVEHARREIKLIFAYNP